MNWVSWVKEKLGLEHKQYGVYYVYQLIDPRTEPPRVMYIGKGKGNRALAHAAETRALLKKGRAGAMRMRHKHKWIIDVWDSGHDVLWTIVYRTDDEEEAYQVESKMIDHFGLEKLTNATYGRRPKTQRTTRRYPRRAS